MARTLMAHSSGLARTNIMVPTDHSMHYPHRIAETIYLARTMFQGTRPVRAIDLFV